MNIILILLLAIVCLGIGVFFICRGEDLGEAWMFVIGWIFIILSICSPIACIELFGCINYLPSEDIDKARIVAVTQEQDLFKTYYKIDIEN